MYHDNDHDFDERGVLRDGRSVKVPMFAMDSASPRDGRTRSGLHDGHGNPVGHRPGFVVSDAVSQETRDAIEEAYAEYLDYIQNAWRDDGKKRT